MFLNCFSIVVKAQLNYFAHRNHVENKQIGHLPYPEIKYFIEIIWQKEGAITINHITYAA